MRVEERVVDEVTVLAVSGRMARNEDYGVLRQRIHERVEEGQRKFVLDLAAVSYMDSTCLGDLIGGAVTVRKKGGTMHLANLTHRVERLMKIAQLDQVFEMYTSEKDAVDSLSRNERQ